MASNNAIFDRFESADSTLAEASEGLNDFNSILKDFALTNKAVATTDFDVKTNQYLHKVRLPTPAKELRQKAYRVVCDARNALDQSVYAGTTYFDGKASGKNTFFPYARSPVEFDSLFKSKKIRCGNVARQLIPTLKKLEPWPRSPNHLGGNDLLWFLCKISGPNKHEVGLSAVIDLDTHHVMGGSVISGGVVIYSPPERVTGTNDYILFSTNQPMKTYSKHNVSFSIGLSQPVPGLPNDAVLALSALLAVARESLNTIKEFVGSSGDKAEKSAL